MHLPLAIRLLEPISGGTNDLGTGPYYVPHIITGPMAKELMP
jgi:hypothetical protein